MCKFVIIYANIIISRASVNWIIDNLEIFCEKQTA